jgi:hypothetical protein
MWSPKNRRPIRAASSPFRAGRPKSPSTPPGLSSGSHVGLRTLHRRANIPKEDWPEAFANWIAERTGGPVPGFEKVEPGDEQIPPPREQRELDALPSGLDRGENF